MHEGPTVKSSSTSSGLTGVRPAASGSQLFARKSIDKLIAESEEPQHRLKKTLGPVALPRSALARWLAREFSPSSALLSRVSASRG